MVGHDVDGATLPRVRSLLGSGLAATCGDPLCDEVAPALAGG